MTPSPASPARGGSLKGGDGRLPRRPATPSSAISRSTSIACPFNVARAYDEARGLDHPRIWTADRDAAMWAALQE